MDVLVLIQKALRVKLYGQNCLVIIIMYLLNHRRELLRRQWKHT